MQHQSEYAGYSLEPEDTFEWSTRRKVQSIRNALSSLKEECFSEAHVTENHAVRDLMETTAQVLEALERSFERDFEEDGSIFASKSDEPWD